MDSQLQQYLDGARSREALSAEDRREADRWDALAEALRQEPRVPPWLEGRVMQALLPRVVTPRWRRMARALLAPREVTLSIRPLLVAGAVALAAIWVLRPAAPSPPGAGISTAAGDGRVLVQFSFESAGARSVAVAGEFNNWEPQLTLLNDPDGDGLWTALVPLAPGVHQYMFVVDGVEWVADPRAERFVADGFGRDNAVLTVSGSASTL